jgi:hypothetical protein
MKLPNVNDFLKSMRALPCYEEQILSIHNSWENKSVVDVLGNILGFSNTGVCDGHGKLILEN